MALNIVELFGYAPEDHSRDALQFRSERSCPFIKDRCTKRFNSGERSGVCTVKPATSEAVVCCPNRLYADDYQVLLDVAESAFGRGVRLISGIGFDRGANTGRCAVVFGKRWGKELRLPARRKRAAYFVDWILALIGNDGQLEEFVAVEVQSIDTTGNYRAEWAAYMAGESYPSRSKAGLNWENVSKRILPQLIYKGHVLRREPLCQKGLFFICPTAVYERINERLGGRLLGGYQPQPGSLTFRWYGLEELGASSAHRSLVFQDQFTTTVDQIALAFSAPSNLPPAGVYEEAILGQLRD